METMEMETTITRCGRRSSQLGGSYPRCTPDIEGFFKRFTLRGRNPAVADENLYRYCENDPTDAIDPTGLAEIPAAPELKPDQAKTYPVLFNKKQVGHVKVTVTEPQGDYLKQIGAGPGIYLVYEPDANATPRIGKADLGWIQHVVHLNVRKEGGKNIVEFEDSPRYDNGALNGRIGAESDPTKQFQPNEESRPKTGQWKENPWYGGPGNPNGTGPTGQTRNNPFAPVVALRPPWE